MTPAGSSKNRIPVDAVITIWPMGWTYRITAALARLPNRVATTTMTTDLPDIDDSFYF
jgi:hypothetical protein